MDGRRARRGRGPTPMQRAYCVGWFGTSTTATATPSAKAACLGASSSAGTGAPTACRQWRTGCGRKGMSTASSQRRWRTWTRPDRPGEGLRPDGIEEDEKPNEYPSGASINVSMWDMIEKNFPEPGSERRLQGSSSSASPGKEKRSAGDKKRDRKWREYQESLAAEAAQGARGGTPAPSPQRAGGGHHPGHTTLGDYFQVAKQTKAKPRPLLLRKSGPSSDVELAHRGRMPADQASSSSSAAPDQRDVARACERACGVPCNLRVARQRAMQQSAAVEGAVWHRP